MDSKPVVSFFSLLALFAFVQKARAQEPPRDVSFCEVAKHPKSFDGKMIRVRGSLSVDFEDFSLVDRGCDSQQGIWLAFGGDVPGLVPSTVNDNSRKPGVDIKVKGVPYGITKDENFRRLYALIAARHGDKPVYRVTATLTGAFFAGQRRELPDGKTDYAGFGHLGCCALFVIMQVSEVESVPPANLNIRGTVFAPNSKPLPGFVVLDDMLGGTPPERQRAVTNERGQFAFSNSGQLLRFEDPAYRPLALPVDPGGAPVKVQLEEAKRSDWLVPFCENEAPSDGRIGFSVLFSVPPSMRSRPYDGDDSRSFFISPQESNASADPRLIISTWTVEVSDPDAFPYKTRQRWIKDSSGKLIGIDVRARMEHGAQWRSATFLGHDTAGYRMPARSTTESLDGIIDSACIAKR